MFPIAIGGLPVSERSPQFADEVPADEDQRTPTFAQATGCSPRVILNWDLRARVSPLTMPMPTHERVVSVACHHDDRANRILNLGPRAGVLFVDSLKRSGRA
jgi:hypothetical protein